MINLAFAYKECNVTALSNALAAALGNAISGISVNQNDGVIVHFFDQPTPQQAELAEGVYAGHDPVWLTANKLIMIADGLDEISVTVRAARPDSPITVWIDPAYDDPFPQLLSFAGVTEEVLEISSPDAQRIEVFCAEPNRCEDRLTLEAISG